MPVIAFVWPSNVLIISPEWISQSLILLSVLPESKRVFEKSTVNVFILPVWPLNSLKSDYV